MKHVLSILLLASGAVHAAQTCDAAQYFPCACDVRHYSIEIDAIQSTLPKGVLTLSTLEDGPNQWAKGRNVSDQPLYEITDKPTDGVPSVVKDKKKWFVLRRYTDVDADETSCTPKSDAALNQVEWDCDEQKSGCGTTTNPNVVTMPEEWPHEWYASGLSKTAVALPKATDTHYTQYFLYDDQVEKVSLASSIEKNENYLKVVCDENAKIESCGEGCIAFATDTPSIKGTKAVRIKMLFETDSLPLDLEFSVDGKIDDSRNDLIDLLSKSVVLALDAADTDGNLTGVPLDYLMYTIAARVYAPINHRISPLSWRIQLHKRKPDTQK